MATTPISPEAAYAMNTLGLASRMGNSQTYVVPFKGLSVVIEPPEDPAVIPPPRFIYRESDGRHKDQFFLIDDFDEAVAAYSKPFS